jgi:hypothetical protein
LIAYQRHAHAKQFKRANRAQRSVQTNQGRVCRDIVRNIRRGARLKGIFTQPLSLAFTARDQRQNQRGKKNYSLHASEVECIGKGKAHRPSEFGVKVSVATTRNRSKGGQLIAHVKALLGNPYDGDTLATVAPKWKPRSSPSSPVIVDVLVAERDTNSRPPTRVAKLCSTNAGRRASRKYAARQAGSTDPSRPANTRPRPQSARRRRSRQGRLAFRRA